MKPCLTLFALSMGALAFAACSGSSNTPADTGTMPMDAMPDAGMMPDTGPSDTGAPMDATPDMGMHVVTGDNGVALPIHLTPDLAELYYTQNMQLLATALTGGGLPRTLGVAPGAVTESAGFDVFYLLYDLGPTTMPLAGTLRAQNGTQTSTPTQLARRASILAVSNDWNRVLALENITTATTAGATTTADLAGLGLTMGPIKFATRIPVGPWDPVRRVYLGHCSPAATFTSSISAMVTACLTPTSSISMPAETRVLAHVDLTSSAPANVIAMNVQASITVGVDRSYVLYLDANRHLWGVDRAGLHPPIALMDTSPVTSVMALSGKRFAYTTQSRALKVSSWPGMMPHVILASGAERLERRSNNGAYVMYRMDPVVNGLRDLYSISTSTKGAASPTPLALEMAMDGQPGDVAFTSDNKVALWYSNVTFDGTVAIADAMARATDGMGMMVTLAPQASSILTYSTATNVILYANTRHDVDSLGNDRLAADLAVRKADGSGDLQVLVPNVDARVYRVRKATIVYRMPPGPYAGLWMLSLPTN